MTNTVTTDSDAWSSVTEQSIFLDDGLKFLVGVLQPPAMSTECSTFVQRISEHEFETSSNTELCRRLLDTCALQHSSYYKLFDYRQRALLGLWQSQNSKLTTSSKNSRPPAVDPYPKDAKPKVPLQDVSFSSHVSLLLLVPILESQSRTDPSLAGQCSELLLHCLQNCAPNSLAAEPTSCIKGLADLLCSWLQQANDEEDVNRQEELARCGVKRESLVAALVALACARLSGHLFIQVLDVLLQQRTPLAKLPVGAVLKRMAEYERKGSFSELSVIQTSRFISSWQFHTSLTEFDDSIYNSDQINTLACDGKFLYLVSRESKGLVKIGTGKLGTFRGAIYARNTDLKNGWLTFVQQWLLFRPKQFDNQPANLCYVLDVVSLKVLQTIAFRDAGEAGDDETQALQCKTIQLLSDQVHLFWLWCSKPSESARQESRKVDLWLQEFKLEACDDSLKASPCKEPVVVSKREEPPSCLSSPLPVRHSPTTPTGQKDTDDPTNYCFSTVDGSCVKHEIVVNSASPKWQDLIAPGLSVCHDAVNSRLWSYCCSHIGEWVAGGLPSCSQISQLLGTSSSQSAAVTTQDSVDPMEASSLLAHHITYLCRRQNAKTKVAVIENEEIYFGDTSDFCSIRHICNVLNAAITNGQHDVTIAMLVALQTLLIQVSKSTIKLDDNSVKEVKHLVWKLVQSPSDSIGAEIKLEASKVLTVGMEVFYSTPLERSALLMLLLSEGESSSDMAILLNFLLTNLTENLMSHKPEASSKARFAEDVVFAALRVSVKESCNMIRQCSHLEDEPFCALVTKHPELSPVLHYVTAVFIRNWRAFVLSEEQESDLKVSDDAVKLHVAECQELSLKILEACQQILDVVLEVLSKLSEECKGNVKSRVEGLEHVMKATLVGQTLPVLASVVSSERCLTLSMAKIFVQSVTNLTVTAAREHEEKPPNLCFFAFQEHEENSSNLSFFAFQEHEENSSNLSFFAFQEHEEKPSNLPFFDDLYLNLSVLTHSLLMVRYQGPANTEAEDACQHLLDSKLLQRSRRLFQISVRAYYQWIKYLVSISLFLSVVHFSIFVSQAKSKELELLCSLKNVEFDPIEQEKSVGKLIEWLDTEAKAEPQKAKSCLDGMPVTKKFLFSIMECAELLCNVTIEASGKKPLPERSISHYSVASHHDQQSKQVTSKGENLAPSSPLLSRSFSEPSTLDQSTSLQEGIHDVRRLQRWRTNVQKKHSRASFENQTHSDARTFVSTVAEIFTFIGSDPDKAVTCSSFLAAARVRNKRGLDRVQALQFMIELVTVCSRLGLHLPYVMSAVASILGLGPRTEELKCGGMVREVRDMFSAAVQAVVQGASSEPAVYRDSVLVLSVCPFSWHEERCVMRSGLVYLLDKLCSMRSKKTDIAVNLSAMAWAGFQVLLDLIVQWENGKDFRPGAIEWSGLAHQVSSLLSNYLSCVLEESRKDSAAARDALQYVMELLHGISRSKLGEGILREPRTISTLLSLLLDRQAPPKLILIVLKLCCSALPLMSAKTCEEVELPSSAKFYFGGKHEESLEGSSVFRVAKLLLAKLGDFVLPSLNPGSEEDQEEDMDEYDDSEIADKDGDRMCLYVHKRDDQPAHEVVQKFLSTSSMGFIFIVGQGSELERAVKLDQELTEFGRGVLLTDTLSACLKKAAEWAQTGLVVSVGPAALLERGGGQRKPSEGSGDPERVCKARNSRLSRTETSRPFMSGQVAHSMASEVISLLHSLLTHSTSETAKIWASSVRDVLCEALNYVPGLVRTLEAEGRILSDGVQAASQELEPEVDGKTGHEQEWFFKARNIMASLCALGGFGQSVHSGCTVQITGEDMVRTPGEVVSVSERQGVATVLLDKGGETYSDRVQEIPLARLKVANAQVVFLSELSMEEQTVAALLTILNSKEVILDKLLESDQSEKVVLTSPAARILAEMKTRASMVLSCQIHDSSFITAILKNPSLELISRLSGECDPGLRLPVIQKHCQQLRKLFKDFVKPSEPPKKVTRSEKQIVLDGSRVFPPVRGCVFTEGHTCVHFMADPTAGFGLPRGTFVYASSPLPQKAPSFYWEVELCSLGDKEDQEPGPCISVGFAPRTDVLASGWVNPVGSCLLHSNGRAVLYRTGGLLQWKTVSLNIVMKEKDVIGCGYKRAEDQADKGTVYFTCNGERLAESLDGVQSGLWPVLHIQKKNVRVRVNFGARSFFYAEGSKHRLAADLWSDSLVDVRQGFTELPFALEPDQDEDMKGKEPPKVCKPSPPKPAPLNIPNDSAKEYDPLSCLQYKLTSSYHRMTDVGPVTPLRASEEGNSRWGEAPPVDPARLLVKAWEEKVFPVIRRRFRSNTDRQSGLEQIKGALLAGMIEIAIATVADLYEDNGGIPTTLQFPTLDDVKADVNKVSAGGLRPGQAVFINSPTLNQAASLPGFAVPDMKKTFGLTGVVKNVDKPQGLAEVETYNREEGTLMRFWYPINALERPTAGLARSSSLALCSEDRTRADLYCELLRNEASMTRMYCREAHSRLLSKLAENHNQMSDILSLLQALAVQLLAVPQSNGTIIMTSPHSASDPRHCLTANTLQPSTVFFSEPAMLISEVRKLLCLAVDQDEEEVLRMVNTMCEVLKCPSLGVHHREMSVMAGKEDEVVYFPGAAVTVVSCREDPGCLNTGGLSNPKSPCVSISCYHGNQKVNKDGQVARYKVVQYPNTAEPNCSAPAGAHLYPDVILPCNRLDVRCSSSATEGLVLHLNAFPAEFFLSLVFIEVFISFYEENSVEGFRNSKNTNTSGVEDTSSRRSLNQKTVVDNLIEILSSFLMKSDLPAVVKEIIYHLLGQLIRVCHFVESQANQPHSADHLSALDHAMSRLSPLRVELQKLLEKELSATNTAALDFILNCNFEHSEFSSYLQALLGLVSATNEVSSSQGKSGRGLSIKEVREALQDAVSSDKTDNVVRSAPPTSVDNMFNFEAEAAIPPSATETAATETAASSGPPSPKVKASERRGSVRRRKRGFGHGVTSPTESMPWFDKVVSTTLLLRNLIHKDSRGLSQLSDSLAAVIAAKSTALQRLLVITNIATTLSKKEAVEAIKKACRASGGIHESVVYIPEVESRGKTEEPGSEKDGERVDSRVKSMTELLPSAQREKSDKILGYAVVELKSSSQLDLVCQTLMSSKTLKDPSSTDSSVGVAKVNSELLMEGTNELTAFAVFDEFLNARLFTDDTAKLLSELAKTALAEIFSSCARVSNEDSSHATEARSISVDSVTDTALQTAAVDLRRADTASMGSTNKAEDTESQVRAEMESRSQEIPRQDIDLFSSNSVQGVTKSNQINLTSITEVLLANDQICRVTPGNLLLSFFNAVRHAKESTIQLVTQILRNHGNLVEGTDERVLGLDGFLNWALSRSSQGVRSIWRGLIACGYDLQFKRCTHFLPSEMESDHANWPVARDHALVLYVDTLCRAWSTTPSRLMPDELLLSEVDLTGEDFHQLQGVSLRSLRSRFAFLKSLNADVERLLLPVTDFRAADSYNLSTAALLRDARGLLFYHTKVALLNHVLNHTAHREADDPPPEVSIDPLQSLEVSADKVSSAGPQFCQAAHNITAIPSSGLRVKVATGGDPVFPLKVVLQGEQVLGSGGSFRHFMWLMARELQGTHVGLLVPCPSTAANKNKGKFILKPGPMTYTEEELLIFFGQLLGIALRADIPLALDLLPCFWKSLLNLPLDPQDDLRETDILTYNYLRRFSEVESAEEFQMLCFEADLCPYRFVYTSLDGEEVELCENGADVAVTWENHRSYVQAIRDLRLKELRCESRMAAVRCGLSSVVPLHVLTVMTPLDMEIRTCGQPSLDLGFLKAHTCYVAGVKDTDVHIEYFWNSMESFSQDQLRKFVKFACNQERLPSRCTCQDGNPNTADVHVPPYPMKIGPPDGRGPSDARYIRVETCMFMVKLPQYSTQEIMTEKLLYAINCREDPLTDIT
ncbi:putative E3 ubiquitin-protein ligase HECTD4 [Stylophora pistillata]|uniref:Putative E3 ubiquitin-protein ligase HECTD4 n=1 Tax=Stylophora pistillata TaxID=50429 RepID=A0A2B4S7C6_STYPI|nr:putative E3 ubiquitin-protein ligase HECTD4 [Stylophora pistillata]